MSATAGEASESATGASAYAAALAADANRSLTYDAQLAALKPTKELSVRFTRLTRLAYRRDTLSLKLAGDVKNGRVKQGEQAYKQMTEAQASAGCKGG